jgi:hypothetical protein
MAGVIVPVNAEALTIKTPPATYTSAGGNCGTGWAVVSSCSTR